MTQKSEVKCQLADYFLIRNYRDDSIVDAMVLQSFHLRKLNMLLTWGIILIRWRVDNCPYDHML